MSTIFDGRKVFRFAGTAKKPTIRINVNSKQVYSNNSCINHARYSWKDSALSFTLKSSSTYASYNSLYGRKVAGKNEDGTTKTGSWVQLLTFDVPLLRANSVTVTKARDVTESDENNPDATNIDLSGNVYYIPKDYVELGFDFETVSGLSWAYSNVFWTAANAKTESADTIFIEQAGTSRRPSLKVTVNNTVTVNKTYTTDQDQYNWSANN